jgi:ATP-dependent helicase HepA
MVPFAPGQRWISNTESELGLGIVVETTNRRVALNFPAASEKRLYATDNAPLSRVAYQVGEQVSSEDGTTITIGEVIEKNGYLIYGGVDESDAPAVLPEQHLNSFVQFSKPQDRLFAGQIDSNQAFRLRCETQDHIGYSQGSPVRGLLGPRVQLLPHQLFIANEAAGRFAPRVLLADEVGLGKTIEAGLIAHQQLITGRARRILIVVPESLLHQWLVEMLRRFNLFFTILDEERCQGLAGTPDEQEAEEADRTETVDQNPFESSQLVLCTLPFLADNPDRHAQAVAAEWDLLIVDEAHHLQWSEQQASAAYQCIETLAGKSRGLLLLTATPEQLGVEGHFARLRLLDPDRYYDLRTFISEESKHQQVNQLVQQLLADDAAEQLREGDLAGQLESCLGEGAAIPLLAAAEQSADEDFPAALKLVVRDLLDRHGTGRVLFRNTRSTVAGFPERKLSRYPLPVPGQYIKALSEASFEQLMAPELLLGEQWLEVDSRVEWLRDWLSQHPAEKILLICARPETAISLEEHLRVRGGVLSAVFHEGLSLVARDRAAAYFADDQQGAQLLVCSEIGSEGRNFQFSHHLVLFDLPFNPDLLEQRIGRLDRIGQHHPVQIHVPYYEPGPQSVLLRWFDEGLDAFEQTCTAGQVLHEQFEQELRTCMARPEDETAVADLVERTREKSAETRKTLQQGRDRLLELNSFDEHRAEEIIHDLVNDERRQELSDYMEQVFDQFGVEQEHHSINSLVVRPGDHMLVHSFPALPPDGVTATFQRDLSLAREDMQFLTWEHPMVSGAMDMILGGEYGNTAFCTIRLPPLKPGAILLEAMFTLSATGPADLQLHRFLPLSTIRVLIDNNHKDLSGILTHANLNQLARTARQRNAQDLVRYTRPRIAAMVSQTEIMAEQQRGPILKAAIESMHEEQDSELSRLRALADVNPNIRPEELHHLEDKTGSLVHYLESAPLRLDAIRVAMVTDQAGKIDR